MQCFASSTLPPPARCLVPHHTSRPNLASLNRPSVTSSAMKILDSVIVPTLTIAKAGVTGIGIPGVEPAFNGVLELAEMLSTMEANKEDLLDLKKNLGSLTTTIDNLDAGGELKQRLTTLSFFRELKGMVPECTTLAEKHSLQRFFKSKNYKQRIQDMKSTMESHLYKFTFYGNISIEKIVQDIASNIQ
ncbi:hypothetical protein B0H14DRAFT_3157303, partial [Mycena olivaceomarginata]